MPAYDAGAQTYERDTTAFQQYREAIVDALPVRPGQVVLDVGCGTGLCCGLLRSKVGTEGRVVGKSTAKEATVKQLPISKGIAGVSMALEPGGMRELHWHATAAEWEYVFAGQVRVSLFGANGRYRTETLEQGDVGYVQQGYGHSLENVGDKPCRVLIGFNSRVYEDIDLSEWLAANPADVLATNFGEPASLFEKFPHKDVFITGKP